MYYVIKKQADTSPMQILSFQVPKYITNKSNDTVIFEFLAQGKTVRKWVKKKDIILLTEDKTFYLKTVLDFEEIKNTQEELVEKAKVEFDLSIKNYCDVMDSKLESFEEIRKGSDIPCLLKDL